MKSKMPKGKIGSRSVVEGGELNREMSPNNRSEEFAFRLELRRAETEKLLVVWKAVFNYAQNAIQATILANGAAATAILTYAGKNEDSSLPHLMISALFFAFGVSCGVIASILAYLSQYDVVKNAVKNDHKVVLAQGKKRIWGIAAVAAGLVAFMSGVFSAALQ